MNSLWIDSKVTWELGLLIFFQQKLSERQVIGILSLMAMETPRLIKIQDNANVRGLIKVIWETLAQNVKLRRNWSEDLKIPLIVD